jgi:hypothetical protein
MGVAKAAEERKLTSNDHWVSKKATPTMVNSIGINARRK